MKGDGMDDVDGERLRRRGSFSLSREEIGAGTNNAATTDARFRFI